MGVWEKPNDKNKTWEYEKNLMIRIKHGIMKKNLMKRIKHGSMEKT